MLLRGTFTIFILLILVIVFLVLGNIYTYKRLVDEKPIAKLTFSFVNEHEYDATFRLANNCDAQIYKIYGDEWRIDAQFLKWKSWATLFDVDAMYRVERLSGRYSDVNNENSKQHIAYEIKPSSTLDLSNLADRYKGKFPPVDTVYGSSAYKKMQPTFLYTVFRTQSGILIREEELTEDQPGNGCVVDHSSWRNAIVQLDQKLASLLY